MIQGACQFLRGSFGVLHRLVALVSGFGSIWCYQSLRSISGKTVHVKSTSSYGWPNILILKFLRTRLTSCSTCIREIAMIWRVEYDSMFPSIFVNSFIFGFIEDGYSCATHFVACYLDGSLLSGVCSSVSCSPSACAKKNVSSSTTSGLFVLCSSLK